MTDAEASIAACREAIAMLLREKAALLDAVLALKAKERAYWRQSLADEQAALRHSEQILAAAHADSDAARNLQARNQARKAAIIKYERRVARADEQEGELRAAVGQHHRELERLERELATPITAVSATDAIDIDGLVAELMAMSVRSAWREEDE